MSAIRIITNQLDEQKATASCINKTTHEMNQTLCFYQNMISMKRQLDAVYGSTECQVDLSFRQVARDFENNPNLYLDVTKQHELQRTFNAYCHVLVDKKKSDAKKRIEREINLTLATFLIMIFVYCLFV